VVLPKNVEWLTDDGIVTEQELRTAIEDQPDAPSWYGEGRPRQGRGWGLKLFALEETGQIRSYSGLPGGIVSNVEIPGIGGWNAQNHAGLGFDAFEDWVVSGLNWETNEQPEGSETQYTSGELAALSVGADESQVFEPGEIDMTNAGPTSNRTTVATTGKTVEELFGSDGSSGGLSLGALAAVGAAAVLGWSLIK